MIAFSKPQTIGPAIPPLLGGDLSRWGSCERSLSRPSGTKAAGRASGGERVSAGMRVSYFPAKPLINYPNVVPSLSLGLPRKAAATPGKLPHKIQPLISRECGPREARIRTAANSPKIQNSTLKIQHSFPHPQTNPHPKSTVAHHKSTVDLGYEGLIRVENGLRPPLSPTYYRPKSGPKIKESNQNQTATNQKIYFASLIIPASRSILPPSPSTANEEFQVKTRPFFANLFYPIPAYANLFYPFLTPSFFTGHNQGSLFTAIFHSKLFKAIQGFLKHFFMPPPISHLGYDWGYSTGGRIGSSLALGCCPKTFGVGAFTMVAVRKDQPIYLYLPLFTSIPAFLAPPGGRFYLPCILQPLQTY